MSKLYKFFLVLLAFAPFASTANDSCYVNFSAANANLPLTKVFTAQTWHNNQNAIEQICWKFGDGTDTCITAALGTVPPLTIQHTYLQPGIYTVCVRVKFQGGCIAEKCNTLQVGPTTQPDSCKADYTVSGGSNVPGTKVFTPVGWHNNNKPVMEVRWDFGDGTPLVVTPGLTSVTHIYPQAGSYIVCIRIKYDGGCVAEKCRPLVITNPVADSCAANFQVLQTNSNPLTKAFVAQPWHSNQKPPVQICWKFGDGTDTCLNATSGTVLPLTILHTYAQPGTYTVCIRIKYLGDCVAEKCHTIIVTQPGDSCRADFEISTINSTPLGRKFTALPWNSAGKKPQMVCWTFGDGRDTCIPYTESYTGLYFYQHQYNQPGTYSVCVKIKYFGGCTAEKCRPVIIATPPSDSCRADFEVMPVAGSILSKTFAAQPWHAQNKRPEQICWKFGDGTDTCISYNPGVNYYYLVTHTYAQPGNYTVCVKIKYQGGCVSEKCKPVTVGANTQPDSCRADFEAVTYSISPRTKKFTALPWHNNNKRPEKICWTFGDGRDTCITYNPGNVNNVYSVLHTYAQNGMYTVCVKIKYQGGCEAQFCRPVSVTEQPCRAQFTDSMISRFKVKFKGQAIIAQPNNPVVSWQWTFGDGASGTGQNVIHEYNQPGSYTVCLKITTANGCQNTVCKVKVIDSGVRILQLHPNPVINTLYITYYSFANEQAQVKIYNVFGIMVKSFTRQMTVGFNNFSTDVATLPPGPYSLVVQTPTTTAASVFFKQ